MSDGEDGLAPPSELEVQGVPGSGVPERGVRLGQEGLPDPRVYRVPDVQINGRAIEVQGGTGGLVIEILEDWLKAQSRRIEFIRRGGTDAEGRRAVAEIQTRMGHIYRLLGAWDQVKQEGGLTVTEDDAEIQ